MGPILHLRWSYGRAVKSESAQNSTSQPSSRNTWILGELKPCIGLC